MTEQTAADPCRNLPNAEKSKDMVNAEEVEVLLHVLQPGPPPCKIVFFHLVPVICRETPQLTVSRERVRRSAGLGIHVELGRMLPCCRTADLCPCRSESLAHETVLLLVDTFVIHLRKGLKFCFQCLVTAVPADTCLRKIDKLRMQGVDGIRAVWI